jgi:hypothetical protein
VVGSHTSCAEEVRGDIHPYENGSASMSHRLRGHPTRRNAGVKARLYQNCVPKRGSSLGVKIGKTVISENKPRPRTILFLARTVSERGIYL